MFVIGGIILGVVIGVIKARKRGGNTLDILQYGAVFAILFGVLGLLLTIGIHRMSM